jgi:hypothetical protein
MQVLGSPSSKAIAFGTGFINSLWVKGDGAWVTCNLNDIHRDPTFEVNKVKRLTEVMNYLNDAYWKLASFKAYTSDCTRGVVVEDRLWIVILVVRVFASEFESIHIDQILGEPKKMDRRQ